MSDYRWALGCFVIILTQGKNENSSGPDAGKEVYNSMKQYIYQDWRREKEERNDLIDQRQNYAL